MSEFHGKFCWYELLTTDTAAAQTFYCDVIGWSARDSGIPGEAYTILCAGATGVGGLMALPDSAAAMGARPGWIGYVAVEDTDAMAARLTGAGGIVHRAPADIPGVGRFAVVADPHGAVFTLFTPLPDHPPPPPTPVGTPGHATWHELRAGDLEADFAFYAGLFGWSKGEALDMGPMGTYQIMLRDGEMFGGAMTKPEAMPVPFWLYYFHTDAIDAAVTRVIAGGGTVVHGPAEVPGGSWMVQRLDPQGAMFALTAAGR